MTEDRGYGVCHGCGGAWFHLAPPPDAEVEAEFEGTAVSITPDGSISSYAGVLVCEECGTAWSDRPGEQEQRPRLFLVPPLKELTTEPDGPPECDLDEEDCACEEDNNERAFAEIASAEADAAMVLSFTQRLSDDMPEIDVIGGDPEDFDQMLALGLKGLVSMTLNALGWVTSIDDSYE